MLSQQIRILIFSEIWRNISDYVTDCVALSPGRLQEIVYEQPAQTNKSLLQPRLRHGARQKEERSRKQNKQQRSPASSGNTTNNAPLCAHWVRPHHLTSIIQLLLSIHTAALPTPVIPTIDL